MSISSSWKVQGIILVFIVFTFWFLSGASVSQAYASPTKTAKVCHLCETIAPVSTGIPTANVADEPRVVHAVLFWMEGCPHCEVVLATVLPPVEEKYGASLVIQKVEIKSAQEVDQLYQLGNRLGIPKEEIGVPLMLLGEHTLIGDQTIAQELPGMVEAALAQGGVAAPEVPEFSQTLISTPLAAQSTAQGEPCTSCEVFDMEDLSPTLTAIANQLVQTGTQKPPQTETPRVAIYLFWGDGCPHCAEAKPFLLQLDQATDHVALRMYEIWNDAENQALLSLLASGYGFEPRVVPTIFIGNQYWEGFDDQIRGEIQAAVDGCLVEGCPDAGAGIVPGIDRPANAHIDGEENLAQSGQEQSNNLLNSSTTPILILAGIVAAIFGLGLFVRRIVQTK